MKIFDREITRRWLRSTSGSLIIFLVLFLTVDLFGLIEIFVKNIPQAITLIKYFLNRILFASFFLLPIALILGGFWTINNLRESNELISYLNTGLDPRRILLFPLVTVFVSSLIMCLLGVLILPSSARIVENLRETEFKSKTRTQKSLKNIHFKLLDGRAIKIAKFNLRKSLFSNVTVSKQEGGKILKRWDAEHGYYRQGKGWILTNIKKRTFGDGGSVSSESLATMTIPLEPPKLLRSTFRADPRRSNRHPAEFALQELLRAIQIKSKRGMNVQAEKVYLHWKFAFPLGAFLLGFVGLYLGMLNNLNKIKGISFCLVIGFGYWIAFNALLQFGQFSVDSEIISFLLPIVSTYGLPTLGITLMTFWYLKSHKILFY